MKTAHKTLAAIFALLAIAFFAACSSDSSDDFANTTWTASDDEGNTETLAFGSGGTVTMSSNDHTGSGTYTVSGSMVTITITVEDDENTYTQERYFIYVSGQLKTADLIFTTTSSLDSSNFASRLAGTTWTFSSKYSMNGMPFTQTIKLEFGSDGTTATLSMDGSSESGTYTVSGSTVTIDGLEEYSEYSEYTYLSGYLLDSASITTYTKN